MGIHVGLCERTTEKPQGQKVLEMLTDWLALVKVGSGHKKLPGSTDGRQMGRLTMEMAMTGHWWSRWGGLWCAGQIG